MLIAMYACGQDTGSSRPGDSVPDQLDCIRLWIDHADSKHDVNVTEFTDLDQHVEPMLRPGIQCLLQWLNSAGAGAAVVVAHAKFLFYGTAGACGQLTMQLQRNDIHFVKENLHVGTINRHQSLSCRIRSALASHAHALEGKRRRRHAAVRLHGNGEKQAWYGYRRKGDIFVPEDSELRLVHLCHDLRLAGYSALRIKKELSQSHDIAMSRSMISKIVRRPRPRHRSEWAFLSPIFVAWVLKRRRDAEATDHKAC
jgi:hypothetical protein